jgi:ribonuclease E
MTRKRIGEGLLESFAGTCPECQGRGVVLDDRLLGQ